ncbi:MAG: hypothetical protein AB7R69_05140, partial [Candidatus Babeliales bacterium]
MKRFKIFLILTATIQISLAIDNPHFYRALYFWGEPRLEFPWLASFDISLGGGNTHTARNSNGKKTPLLNIYGPHNMHKLGADVPGLNPANPLDAILINLDAIPDRPGFGQLLFSGKFQIIESYLNVYQNLINGFFLQANIPIRKLKITQIAYEDLSPDDTIFPNKNTPVWQEFLANFNAILNQFDLKLKGADRTDVGDLAILGGWTTNYENTKHLDYIDVTAKLGVLFPTGKRKKLSRPFDIPQGYDGFYGVPLKFDISLGALEWLTLGSHLGALFFIERGSKNIRMRTNEQQNGFIKLTYGDAKIDQGTIWDYSGYIKADHVIRGLSFLCGYSYTKKDRDCLEPKNSMVFDPLVVNKDR